MLTNLRICVLYSFTFSLILMLFNSIYSLTSIALKMSNQTILDGTCWYGALSKKDWTICNKSFLDNNPFPSRPIASVTATFRRPWFDSSLLWKKYSQHFDFQKSKLIRSDSNANLKDGIKWNKCPRSLQSVLAKGHWRYTCAR